MTSFNDPMPMEIDQARAPLTIGERHYRRTNGICLYYGASTHLIRFCPLKNNLRQVYLNNPTSGSQQSETTVSNYSRSHVVGQQCCSHSSTNGFSFEVTLHFQSISIQSLTLLESGATTCFMDEMFVHKHNFPVVRLTKPILVEAMDGRMLSSSAVTEATISLILQLGIHKEALSFYLII